VKKRERNIGEKIWKSIEISDTFLLDLQMEFEYFLYQMTCHSESIEFDIIGVGKNEHLF
jgi:hypothetical protein